MELKNLDIVHGAEAGSATDGVAITSYGKGQLAGTTYTVPAHGKITVDFTLQIQCVSAAQVQTMDQLIRGLLKASEQGKYDSLEKTHESSGGRSFLFFWSTGRKASSKETKKTLTETWGLTEAQQSKIIQGMLGLASKMNTFHYSGTIFNKEYDYAVTGNLFGIVMDATIQQAQSSAQVRFLGPNVHLESSDGVATLPSVGKLY